MTDFQINNDKCTNPSLNAMRNADQKHDKVLNKANLKSKIIASLTKYGLNKTNFTEVENIIGLGLEEYLKNIIENLIKISRVRNLNLNLYSKLAEKNQALKIHTHNFDRSINNNNTYEINPYKDFSIIFTRNMKSLIDKVNNYEELSSSKNQFEKITSFKNKMEQVAEMKEKDKEKNNNTTATPKVRTRKRENQFMKLCKKEFEKTKQKEDKNRQKKESLNTLEYFLDKPKQQRESSVNMRIDSEMASNLNESQQNNFNNMNIETHTKLSDNISKSENIACENNELFLTVYKSHIPNENLKTNPDIKRRVILKDLIFFLENNLKTPLHNFILHKAILKLNLSSNQ